eukprot:TRINITY_DN8997_c1_g1_i1.p1 TRINITY_DN8997_c1_g1~~TRINITY_DN8997_c1_g1_i1.p1  ORF type:complete len:4144 (+),score=716.08 TRINITY_DN8997_c1_g1_i1:58-12489(+)
MATKPFWRQSPFVGLLADPYISGTPLASGHVGNSIAGCAEGLKRILKEENHSTRNMIRDTVTEDELKKIPKVIDMLEKSFESVKALAEMEKPEQVLPLVSKVALDISSLTIGEKLIVPAGWVSLNNTGTVIYIVQRDDDKNYSMVVCNGGSGLMYHPAIAEPDKIKYKTCLKISRIPLRRISDQGFWLFTYLLFTKDPPSEYSRVEVIYDMLLPWMAEITTDHDENDDADVGKQFSDILKNFTMTPATTAAATATTTTTTTVQPPSSLGASLLAALGNQSAPSAATPVAAPSGIGGSLLDAIKRAPAPKQPAKAAPLYKRLLSEAFEESKSDPHSVWRSPSKVSAHWKSLWEAVRYLMSASGIKEPSLKVLSMALRKEFLVIAAADLIRSLPADHPLITELTDKHGAVYQPIKLGVIADALSKQQSPLISNDGTSITTQDILATGCTVIAVYVSGSWCGPCKKFTPFLVRLYERVLKGRGCEVIFVSSDKTKAEFEEYHSTMPWPAVPYAAANPVAKALGVSSIPTLLLFDAATGSLITDDGVGALMKHADDFPWPDKSVLRPRIGDDDARLLNIATKQLSRKALKEFEKGRLHEGGLHNIHALADCMLRAADAGRLPDSAPRLIRSSEVDLAITPVTLQGDQSPQGPLNVKNGVAESKFQNFKHFGIKDTKGMEGEKEVLGTPEVTDMMSIPSETTAADESAEAIEKCQQVCEKLVNRARESSTTSRIVLHHQTIAAIGALITKTIPMPKPFGDTTCPWAAGFSKGLATQKTCLHNLYKLVVLYVTVWQSVERPTRGCDSERFLVSAGLLAVYDRVLRMVHGDTDTLLISSLMAEDGGYFISTKLCQDGRSFETVAQTLELESPHFTRSLSCVVAYFRSLQETQKTEIFDWRMLQKVELRKYGSTCMFLRKIMERAGLALIPDDDGGQPTCEMEALVNWLTQNDTQLSSDHPEFGWTRDFSAIFRFAATMETRDCELIRRRKDGISYQFWRLSFDDSLGRRGGSLWMMRQPGIHWDLSGVRGHDFDIADLTITGFGGRELRWGEGPVVHSPTDLQRILQLKNVTEDDVIHHSNLPTYGDTLSREESERLMSSLTVRYIAIPLVLDFFATMDRHTYLFNPGMQQLLRSVLFEPGCWSPEDDYPNIPHVPLRQTALQKKEASVAGIMDATFKNFDEKLLGTNRGLLLNELRNSPHAVLQPLLKITRSSMEDLSACSVYSANAHFMCFLVNLLLDVYSYAEYALRMISEDEAQARQELGKAKEELQIYLSGSVAEMLGRWMAESEKANDMSTASVMHAFLAMVAQHDESQLGVKVMLGSAAYVRNWHGFGLGRLRSDILSTDADGEEMSPEQRLIRFLQSQGIDTSTLSSGALDKYVSTTGRSRPLFLHVGREVVRVPTLLKTNADTEGDAQQAKLPPWDMPETKLFRMLQYHRSRLVNFVKGRAPDIRDDLMNEVVRTALRNPGFKYQGWESMGLDRYLARRGELNVDIQGFEVLWRNDALRPVPDSMTQFPDFETIFGREPLHCGVINRHKHRHWVHIVGTEYDLAEWDEPNPANLGAGFPVEIPRAGETDEEVARRLQEAEDRSSAPQVMWQTKRRKDEEPYVDLERGVIYNGSHYTRPVDPYSEDPHEFPSEDWVIQILREVITTLCPQSQPLKFQFYLPDVYAEDGVNEVTLLGCDGVTEESLTWKEAKVYKDTKKMEVWMLCTHGRRLFKSLIFSSNARTCLHNLPPSPDKAFLSPILRYAAGNMKQRRVHGPSLIITRNSKQLHGLETYLPPMLLQGLVPSAFLESFNMWMGEDDIIRGEALDNSNSWFNMTFEIHIDTENGTASLHRRAWNLPHTMIKEQAGEGSLFRNESDLKSPDEVMVSEEHVKQMMEIGLCHGEAAIRHALAKCDNSCDAAVQWLMDDNNISEISEVVQKEMLQQTTEHVDPTEVEMVDTEADDLTKEIGHHSPQRSTTKDTFAFLPLLIDEGINEHVARHALTMFGGNADIARQWINDESNSELISSIVEGAGAVSADVIQHKFDMKLLPLNTCQDPFSRQLASRLGGIEDLSHVLVWLLPTSSESWSKISVIELPRIRLKLQPQKDVDGVWQLFLLDEPSWYISSEPPETVAPLLVGLPEYLLVRNRAGDYRVLIPNHDLVRPDIKGVAFPCRLVPLRTSLGWEEVMEQRLYSYPVHVSKSFLVSSGMGPTLYLLLIRLLERNYKEAYRLADGVCTDVALRPDEQWIYDQMERSTKDRHPDATACRLQLSIAVVFSPVKPSWELADEVDWYLKLQSHVTSTCTLTEQEIETILRRCEQGSPLIKNKLACLTSKGEVQLKPPPVMVPGQPWLKMLMASQTYIDSNCTRIQRIQCTPPPSLDDKTLTEFLYSDRMLQDDVGGGGKGLGVVFLYQAVRGLIPMKISGHDISRTAAELLTRWTHLKLARWGKEAVEDGEVEGTMCRQMVALAHVLNKRNRQWPVLPTDTESTTHMKYGVEIYKGEGRHTHVRAFIDQLDAEFLKSVSTIRSMGGLYDHISVYLENLRKDPPSVTQKIDVSVVQQLSKGRKQRPRVSDSARASCLVDSSLQKDLDYPLLLICNSFVCWKTETSTYNTDIPFKVPDHALSTPVANEMMRRLKGDVNRFSSMMTNRSIPILKGLSDDEIDVIIRGEGIGGIQVLDDLISALSKMQDADSEVVKNQISEIVAKSNAIPLPKSGRGNRTEDLTRRIKFALRRLTGEVASVDMAHLAALFVSSKSNEDLQEVNPYTEDTIPLVTPILVLSNRISHANAAKTAAENLRTLLLKAMPRDSAFARQTSTGSTGDFPRCGTSSAQADLTQLELRIKHAARALAELLVQKRHYLCESTFDPRFLLFEFMFSIRLRKRQVEMVNWFIKNLENGVSRVQQMIMGQGKTQVVSPLLVLLLANGNRLVTQVMPSALLQQTRSVLQSCFTAPILPKKVFVLEFDRSVEDSPDAVVLLHNKLSTAAKDRGVVVAPPEAIKSLELKFIELLHSLESTPISEATSLEGTATKRKEAARVRDRMISRSEMADKLTDILHLWKGGALLLDEVDVLLHPLRSELNFPIGNKHAIDLAGQRWDLPMFIIDAVFGAVNGTLCTEIDKFWENASSTAGISISELLVQTQNIISMGCKSNALQTSPHLVLLDTSFYHSELKPIFARWSTIWLIRFMTSGISPDVITSFICGESQEALAQVPRASDKKLLILTREWMGALLPHVLSKINRVGFGLLQEADMVLVDPNTTASRLLTAVPFVGKDVPSRSSEFAHPDVVIGLTTFAYRYEGLRKRDLRAVISQLKKEYSRQFGPRDRRPACVLYQNWLRIGAALNKSSAESVLPLPLFHVSDTKQFNRLYAMVSRVPELIYYYLDHHVFPATMNFQKMKISACGHELGSSLLFGKRAGFSGTPSNLMPLDLGNCEYEPGSDGDIIHTLTSSSIVTAEVKSKWSARSILEDIAKADPPYHALIDTGAYITNMDNNEVAAYLLKYLPEWYEGVVFLDKQDNKMVLSRTGRVVPFSQCGITEQRRFTFYDQIHTTGMDIKQAPTAKAVVTIGKDMTFRDYAQGSYRMRGIGKGQTIRLFIISEVQSRIRTELAEHASGRSELDVPAWLLLNSMRLENLQAVKLGEQELQNTWRKHALKALVGEVDENKTNLAMSRVRRFIGDGKTWVRKCVAEYREVISHDVSYEDGETHQHKMAQLLSDHGEFTITDDDKERVKKIMSSIQGAAAAYDSTELGFESEVVHEQEAEQEQEQEAEQEEQRESAFSRDDEQHNPWDCSALQSASKITSEQHAIGETPFYPLSDFKATESQPLIPFPSSLLLTDNFFRPTWLGLGERRLKVAFIVMTWAPNDAAERVTSVVSLAEAETLRWMMHTRHPSTASLPTMALSTAHGNVIAGSQTAFADESLLLCVRFFNGEMYYTPEQLTQLENVLRSTPLQDRRNFFFEAVRLRRRQRGAFLDTPVAKLFTPQSEWHLIRTRGQIEYISQAMKHASQKGLDIKEVYQTHCEPDGTITPEKLGRLIQTIVPGLSPGDIQNVVNTFEVEGTNLEKVFSTFSLPLDLQPTVQPQPMVEDSNQGGFWACRNCTYLNPPLSTTCEMCDFGWTGQRECPHDKWVCSPETGGCSFFNPKTLYYCEVCNRARPDLATVAF